MIRLILIILAGFLAYRLARRWLQFRRLTDRMKDRPAGRIDDVMVKDPQCGAYFPRRDGVVLKDKDGDLLFCCAECRDKYLAARRGPKG